MREEAVAMVANVSTDELKRKVAQKAKNFKLVETLAPDRYREAHLPGAVNLPPDQVKELAASVLPDKSAEIITYCTNFN
jgi:rhodanese-related sulfurtransferase